MRVEAVFLLVLAAFGGLVAFIYWATGLSASYVTTTAGGTIMLAAFCLLGLLPGSYYFWWSKRMTPRAEDNPHADLKSGAGDVGAFPSSSVWPFVLGLGAALVALSLVFGVWSALVGIALALIAAVGVVSESRRGGVV